MKNSETCQFAASIAPVLFSLETNSQLERLAQQSSKIRAYAIGAQVFIAAAAVHPEQLSVDRRLASFASLPASAKQDSDSGAALQRWADAGFFLVCDGAEGGLGCRCFHCGTRCRFVAKIADPTQLHRRCSPNCELARLLSLISSGSRQAISASSEELLSASADKLRRATAKLVADMRSSQLLERVASYGFDRRLAAFAACRQFMRTRDGQLSPRPGDLIQAMHDSEDILGCLPTALNLEDALTELEAASAVLAVASATATAEAESAVAAPRKLRQDSPPQEKIQVEKAVLSTSSDQNRGEGRDEEDESEQCRVCKLRVRDLVTLPCAHFLLCRQCAEGRRQCPKCDREILATVRAFIA